LNKLYQYKYRATSRFRRWTIHWGISTQVAFSRVYFARPLISPFPSKSS